MKNMNRLTRIYGSLLLPTVVMPMTLLSSSKGLSERPRPYAINVVIFSRYFPDAFTGVRPDRSPIRRTVPEYLFQTPEETAKTSEIIRLQQPHRHL